MLKIMITCGGGFSSSALVNHLNAETKEKGLTDRAEFVFKPYDFGGIGGLVRIVHMRQRSLRQSIRTSPSMSFRQDCTV